MGVEQFANEMNNSFGTEIYTSDFLLGQDENNSDFLFYEKDNSLIALSINENNIITGISLLFLPETDILYQIDYFTKMCSVFTHTQYELQVKNLNDNGISTDKLKFADGNTSVTIGKYKYTVISNAYSITLSCDKI